MDLNGRRKQDNICGPCEIVGVRRPLRCSPRSHDLAQVMMVLLAIVVVHRDVDVHRRVHMYIEM